MAVVPFGTGACPLPADAAGSPAVDHFLEKASSTIIARVSRAPRARAKAPLSRQPEPPAGLPEFEQHVMAADAPDVVLIDRALIRALLRYVRLLEREGEAFREDGW